MTGPVDFIGTELLVLLLIRNSVDGQEISRRGSNPQATTGSIRLASLFCGE
jgi:hypothetical protein